MRTNYYLISRIILAGVAALGTTVAFADANHLVISEVAVYPQTQGPPSAEFVEIYNPTTQPISLDHYGIADTNTYIRLPTAPDQKISINDTDNVLRFPAGYTLQPGQVAVVTGGATVFNNDFFSVNPSPFTGAAGAPLLFEVENTDSTVPDMISANTFPTSPLNFSLTNASGTNGEFVVLFYWDGVSDLVRDVDMVSWGKPASGQNQFAPKLPASGYIKDNGSHDSMSVGTSAVDVVQRVSLAEAGEATTGGNGITGHDETTETPGNWITQGGRNLNMTPGVVTLPTSTANIPPLIHTVTRSIKYPGASDSLVLSANVTDADGTLTNISFHINTGSGFVATPATASGNTYSVTVPALGHAGLLQYYVTATDNSGAISTQPAAGADAPIYVQIGTPPPAASVIINEIQFDIIGADNTEWFELYNKNSSPLSLGGWRIGNNSDRYLTLPADATIAGNGFLLVTYNEAVMRGFYPDIPAGTPVYTYPFSQNNTADTLWLASPNEFNFDGSNVARFEEVSYSKEAPWPTVNPNVTGQSFELINPSLDSSDGSNWQAHPPVQVGGVYQNSGTPGMPNSSAASVGNWALY